MNKFRWICVLVFAAAFTLPAGRLSAHHGTGISYDVAHPPLTLKGTVAEFRWQNPHIILLLDAKDAQGKVTRWAIEGNSIVNWTKRGYNRQSVKVGQEITAVVYPSKVPNTPNAVVAHITLPDGTESLRYQQDTPGGRAID